jgi:hypothetical protein
VRGERRTSKHFELINAGEGSVGLSDDLVPNDSNQSNILPMNQFPMRKMTNKMTSGISYFWFSDHNLV